MKKSLEYIVIGDIEFENDSTFDMVMEALEDSDFTFGDGLGLHFVGKQDLLNIVQERWEGDEEFDMKDAKKGIKSATEYILVE